MPSNVGPVKAFFFRPALILNQSEVGSTHMELWVGYGLLDCDDLDRRHKISSNEQQCISKQSWAS